MAKNRNLSDLDAAQAFKLAMDGEHDAIRVVQALNTEMAIELSAEDNDSVQSVARTRLIKEEDKEVRCNDLREISLYGQGSVELSPDGQRFFKLEIKHLEVKSICALLIRVKGCMVVGRS